MSAQCVVKISGLSVSYRGGRPGREKDVLHDLDLEIEQGELVGLLGLNGAGKTTLIKTLVGLTGFKSGSVSVFGRDARDVSVRAKIGFMPEVAHHHWFMTSAETLAMFGKLAGMGREGLSSRIDDTLRTVGLFEERDILIKHFSKGMQERLSLAQALLHDPDLYILDEPFSGLDPAGRIHVRGILKGLKARGKTVLLSSHELSEAELVVDTVCILKKGRILNHGPVKTLLSGKGEESLEKYFLSMIGEAYE